MAKRYDFYDVKNKKKFTTSNYTIKIKMVNGNKRRFAVATSPYPGKITSWRVLPKND